MRVLEIRIQNQQIILKFKEQNNVMRYNFDLWIIEPWDNICWFKKANEKLINLGIKYFKQPDETAQ